MNEAANTASKIGCGMCAGSALFCIMENAPGLAGLCLSVSIINYLLIK